MHHVYKCLCICDVSVGLQYFYFKFLFLCLFYGLRSGNNNLGLDKVGLHELLEVEVSQLVLLAELKKLGELVVGVDNAAVILVLKVVGVNVDVQLLANIRARHLRSNLLSEELGKLVANASGLHEARWLAVATVLALLRRSLLGVLEFTTNLLVQVLELVLERGDHSIKLLDSRTKLVQLGNKSRGLDGGSSDGRGGSGGSGGAGLNNGDGGHIGLRLLRTRGLRRGGSGRCRNRGSGGSGRGGLIGGGGLCNSNHGS